MLYIIKQVFVCYFEAITSATHMESLLRVHAQPRSYPGSGHHELIPQKCVIHLYYPNKGDTTRNKMWSIKLKGAKVKQGQCKFVMTTVEE